MFMKLHRCIIKWLEALSILMLLAIMLGIIVFVIAVLLMMP